MKSCSKKVQSSVVFQTIKSKKGVVYGRTYTHPAMLKCFGSFQQSATTFMNCVNAAAVAGHSTLSFNGTTCLTYNTTVPSFSCANQQAAAANPVVIYQANPPLVQPNFGSFKVLTVAATFDVNNNFDVTWTAEDGGCSYPGFVITVAGLVKYVETLSFHANFVVGAGRNFARNGGNVAVAYGLPTGETFGQSLSTTAVEATTTTTSTTTTSTTTDSETGIGTDIGIVTAPGGFVTVA
ncbi:uncharacterized protein LOC108666171 isoform X2 [Hyalella azteca]|uniref:Uncharacterized protein LOC108666171 isoform X1 n=1 Tax=Hyalella azteca TaxID=294128 RepID=A0A8B7N5D6_HYAAZ|nr:uncharacterized protein LOC108666171 isoform X1 [Hyalella azteca]XP_047735766.1 uncharacterized protein LOC108666171 isoform X2 [Hyalella azteca]